MLLKSPEDEDAFASRMTFTASARVAWTYILQTCRHDNAVTVLLPAYIGETDREGSGVFDPVRKLNCIHRLYSVSNRLRPDMDSIACTLAAVHIDVLLVIHYFGFVQSDLLALRSLCDAYDVTLVEDCAHVCLLHGLRAGTVGDYAFYSLHKFLPTDTGGVLRANDRDAISVSADDRCDRSVLEQLSRTDLLAAAQCRKRNYEYLYDGLLSASGLTLMYEPDDDTVPQSFPVLVHNNRREELYFHLQNLQMPTISLYYRLTSEITSAEYPVSREVSGGILNLPVHQDTSLDNLELLVAEIRSFLDT